MCTKNYCIFVREFFYAHFVFVREFLYAHSVHVRMPYLLCESVHVRVFERMHISK